MLVSRLKTLSV